MPGFFNWNSNKKSKKPSKKRRKSSRLNEQLEERILFDAVPDGSVDLGDAMADDPFAPSVSAIEELFDVNSATAATSQSPQQSRVEVLFVDRGVEGHQQLTQELLQNSGSIKESNVFFIEDGEHGLAKIASTLSEIQDDVDAIHILSHGSKGELQLGGHSMDAQSLTQQSALLQDIGKSLSNDADILIYGCDLTGNEAGQSFVRNLSDLTGADVASSDDLTGNAEKGGDWELESQLGVIESVGLEALQYSGILADTDGDGIDDEDDIDDDNDGILDIHENTCSTFSTIDFSALTTSDLATLNGPAGGSVNLTTSIMGSDGATPIVVTITSEGASNSANPTDVNLDSTGSHSSGFDNRRDSSGNSGNRITFTFSEPVKFEVDTINHAFFGNDESILVSSTTALDGRIQITATSSLETDGSADRNSNGIDNYFLSGDLTNSVSLESDDENPAGSAGPPLNGQGTYWQVDSMGAAVSTFSVEYFRDDGAELPGREPYRIRICPQTDTDLDGTPDLIDLDSDNDGISDLQESGADANSLDPDGNGVIDGSEFVDVDGDGLADAIETANGADTGTSPVDSDSDGVADTLDLDSDNDGIADVVEAQSTSGYTANDGDVSDQDSDGDGIIDLYDSNDGSSGDFGGTFSNSVDTDGDGTPDYLDTDSDDDGMNDSDESGLTLSGDDTDGDGIDDSLNASYTDPDGDINNPSTDLANQSGDTSEVAYRELQDTDGDGVIDAIDLDDDNDGILDTDECTQGHMNVVAGTITQSGGGTGNISLELLDGDTGDYVGELVLSYENLTQPPPLRRFGWGFTSSGELTVRMQYHPTTSEFSYSLSSPDLDFFGVTHRIQAENVGANAGGRVEAGFYTYNYSGGTTAPVVVDNINNNDGSPGEHYALLILWS